MAFGCSAVRRIHRLIPTLRHAVRSTGDSSSVPPPNLSTFISGGINYQANISRHGDKRQRTSSILDIDGHKIHCEQTGAGKHVLFLLPGSLGSSVTDFGPQLSNINKDIFRLVAWDPPGYGKSYPPERKWPKQFLHEDAKIATRLMEVLDVPEYSLLGWSDGGITAMVMAAHHPERVRKMVVWGANAYITKEEVEMLHKIQNIDSWSERMKKPFIDVYGEEYFRRTWSEWVDAFIKTYYEENNGDICKACLPKITCPTLIIHGDKDPVVPNFHADFLRKEIHGSRLVHLPDGKHNLHLRFYKEFNSIVENFLLEQ